jgi:hypothetical protein
MAEARRLLHCNGISGAAIMMFVADKEIDGGGSGCSPSGSRDLT